MEQQTLNILMVDDDEVDAIDACVQATVTFPARRTWTTATVPYFLLHTDAPNAGPQLSCWDPNGCRQGR